MPQFMARYQPADETFISVDIETAGPYPGRYALLTIGACSVQHPGRDFYIELRPDLPDATPEALEITGLSMAELAERGVEPAEAMRRFEAWAVAQTPEGSKLVFVAFNAVFDWMFVNEYFHRYLGRNPFGHSALDMKALYMGLTGSTWSETSMRYVAARYLDGRPLTHHALNDAHDQAELLRRMLEEARTHGWGWL
jgi:DNA polymerase III epsilon subunit-like protein